MNVDQTGTEQTPEGCHWARRTHNPPGRSPSAVIPVSLPELSRHPDRNNVPAVLRTWMHALSPPPLWLVPKQLFPQPLRCLLHILFCAFLSVWGGSPIASPTWGSPGLDFCQHHYFSPEPANVFRPEMLTILLPLGSLS